MAIFWLVILIGAAQAPLHVGNFPNLDSCQKAANEMVRGSGAGTGGNSRIGAICRLCLRASEYWKSWGP